MTRLDLSRAWNSAATMLKTNRQLVAVVAGVFFFLPLTALFLIVLGGDIQIFVPGAQPDAERMAEQVELFLTRYWWALLLVGLFQLVGALALVRLLADPTRPTVGSAMAAVPAMLLPMIAAQILSAIAVQAFW